MKDRFALPLFLLSFVAFGVCMYLFHDDAFTITKFGATLLTLTSAILSGAEMVE